jgi:hypothetical protein
MQDVLLLPIQTCVKRHAINRFVTLVYPLAANVVSVRSDPIGGGGRLITTSLVVLFYHKIDVQ